MTCSRLQFWDSGDTEKSAPCKGKRQRSIEVDHRENKTFGIQLHFGLLQDMGVLWPETAVNKVIQSVASFAMPCVAPEWRWKQFTQPRFRSCTKAAFSNQMWVLCANNGAHCFNVQPQLCRFFISDKKKVFSLCSPTESQSFLWVHSSLEFQTASLQTRVRSGNTRGPTIFGHANPGKTWYDNIDQMGQKQPFLGSEPADEFCSVEWQFLTLVSSWRGNPFQTPSTREPQKPSGGKTTVYLQVKDSAQSNASFLVTAFRPPDMSPSPSRNLVRALPISGRESATHVKLSFSAIACMISTHIPR